MARLVQPSKSVRPMISTEGCTNLGMQVFSWKLRRSEVSCHLLVHSVPVNFKEKSCKRLAFPSLQFTKAVEHLETFEKYSSVSNYDPLDRLNLFVVPVALPPFSEMASLGRPRVESLVF